MSYKNEGIKKKDSLDREEDYLSLQERDVRAKWGYRESYAKSMLGFSGFAFEVILLSVLIIKLGSVRNVYLLSLGFFITVSPAGWFWWMWAKESRRLRQYVTDLLNLYADVDNFAIPQIQPIHNRYVPEIALLLVLQTAVVIFLTVPL